MQVDHAVHPPEFVVGSEVATAAGEARVLCKGRGIELYPKNRGSWFFADKVPDLGPAMRLWTEGEVTQPGSRYESRDWRAAGERGAMLSY